MITGYTNDLPHDCLLDSGVLLVGALAFGASRGGLKFVPKTTLAQIKFDGRRSDIAGNDRKTMVDANILGKFFQFSANEMPVYEPDSTSATSSGVTTITPKRSGLFFSSGAYVSDLRLIFERGGSTAGSPLYAAVYFPKALCTKYELDGKDQDEAEVSCDFAARLDMSISGARIDDSPYRIELRTSLPT